MKAICQFLLCAGFALAAQEASALGGEVFRIRFTGTAYCQPFKVEKITPARQDPMWLRIDSLEQVSLSASPDFPVEATAVLTIDKYYQTKQRAAAFVATHESEGQQSYVLAKIAWNAANVVRSLSGTAISRSLEEEGDDCFSSGTFTGKFVGAP